MASYKIVLLLAVAAVAVMADERPRYEAPRPSYEAPRPSYEAPRPSYDRSEEDYEDAKYDFEWKVDEDDNDFGHTESRDGDNTQGSYYVALPDGRRQTVTYYVNGDSGYVADVQYSGEARYSEESSEGYAPPRASYQAPRGPYDN
ncbi:Insect cuticle protein [Trinorchestia longiramus]|nr:Insect cuticle protein [Trinorchestia longiramus]